MNTEVLSKIQLSEEELEMINSKLGLRVLFANEKINLTKVLSVIKYENQLRKWQEELVKLQTWVIENGKKVIVLFEGRDSAGKGGAIRRITSHINPRLYRIVALDKPSKDEKGQWYFQRYVSNLPKPGEMVFFDRSWYNRAVVEPVNGFCSSEEYEIFMSHVNEFEDMIIKSDAFLIKLYFSISKEEQKKRFDDIKKSDLKQWKMSPVDEKAQELWDDYTRYKEAMLEKTNTKIAPWIIIDANKKANARLTAIEHLIKSIPYQ